MYFKVWILTPLCVSNPQRILCSFIKCLWNSVYVSLVFQQQLWKQIQLHLTLSQEQNMEISDQVSQLTFSNCCWKIKGGSFLPSPPLPPPCFPLCLACLVQSLSPVKDTSCCPGELSQLANRAEKCKAVSCWDYFQRGQQALKLPPGWCRDADCRAGHSGVLEAELYQMSAP